MKSWRSWVSGETCWRYADVCLSSLGHALTHPILVRYTEVHWCSGRATCAMDWLICIEEQEGLTIQEWAAPHPHMARNNVSVWLTVAGGWEWDCGGHSLLTCFIAKLLVFPPSAYSVLCYVLLVTFGDGEICCGRHSRCTNVTYSNCCNYMLSLLLTYCTSCWLAFCLMENESDLSAWTFCIHWLSSSYRWTVPE